MTALPIIATFLVGFAAILAIAGAWCWLPHYWRQRYDRAVARDPNLPTLELDASSAAAVRCVLGLLLRHAPDAYKNVVRWVAAIRLSNNDDTYAVMEDVPTVRITTGMLRGSRTYCAAALLHEALHLRFMCVDPESYQCRTADEILAQERFCIGSELDLLTRLNAPVTEIKYLTSQDGTHSIKWQLAMEREGRLTRLPLHDECEKENEEKGHY